MRVLLRTRANGHTARISCVSVWAFSIVLSNCCMEGSSWRMLSLRHSIGHVSPLESLARNSKRTAFTLLCHLSP